MAPLSVVKLDPVFDHTFSLEHVLQFMQVYGLLVEGSTLQGDGHFQDFDRQVAQQSPELRVTNVDSNVFQLFDYSGAAIKVKI